MLNLIALASIAGTASTVSNGNITFACDDIECSATAPVSLLLHKLPCNLPSVSIGASDDNQLHRRV